MTGGSQFWDAELWRFMVAVSVLLGGMLLANLLRRICPPLRMFRRQQLRKKQ